MKQWFSTMMVCVFLLTVLAGCGRSLQAGGAQMIIDWVDFLKLDGKSYLGMYNSVLSDSSFVGEEIGKVKFQVADHVYNTGYTTKDGDAAFLPKGTVIYAIKGISDHSMVAVKDDSIINGYRLYCVSEQYPDYPWHYKQLPKDNVKRLEIYKNEMGKAIKIGELQHDDIPQFISILDQGQEKQDFSPDTSNGDPQMYELVFYTDEAMAYQYHLFYDRHVFYWSPWNTSVLPDSIEAYLQK